MPFLDLKVTIKGTGITTSVHYKPTDSHAYLNYGSSHPPACKNSIPFSQLSRIRRLCSEEDDFIHRADEMRGFFRQRGYPDEVLAKATQRVMSATRTDVLRHKKKCNNMQRVPLVVTYHPTSECLAKSVRENFHILSDDPATKDIFSDPPLTSFRKDKNLRQLLVSSKLPSHTSCTGCRPCRRPRCNTCRVISTATHVHGPKGNWKISGSFSCITRDCIYCIYCTKCQQIYVGETKRRLADRVTEHLRSIRIKSAGLPVAQHFNKPDHNIGHFQVSVLLNDFHSDAARKEKEERLIHYLGSLQPGGMNVSFHSFPV